MDFAYHLGLGSWAGFDVALPPVIADSLLQTKASSTGSPFLTKAIIPAPGRAALSLSEGTMRPCTSPREPHPTKPKSSALFYRWRWLIWNFLSLWKKTKLKLHNRKTSKQPRCRWLIIVYLTQGVGINVYRWINELSAYHASVLSYITFAIFRQNIQPSFKNSDRLPLELDRFL